MNYLLLIFLFLGAGLLGGLCSYYLLGNSEEDKTSFDRVPSIVIGVVAALVSPLALHFLGNTWIKEAESNPTNYFLIFAFALVAASYSRRFLESVNRRVLEEVKETKKEVEEIKEQITEPVPEATAHDSEPVEGEDLSADQKRVIEAIFQSKFTYRSLHGLAKELGLPNPSLRETIVGLIDLGLVVERKTKNGALSYGITHRAQTSKSRTTAIANVAPAVANVNRSAKIS